MSKTLSVLALDIRRAFDELGKKEEKSESYKVVIHPSVISYDYRIAWTWDEMEKRNEYNNNVDSIRISFGLPARPYGRPLYSEWTTHYGKSRPLNLDFNDWR